MVVVAQLVERLIVSQVVDGSSPFFHPKFAHVAQRQLHLIGNEEVVSSILTVGTKINS